MWLSHPCWVAQVGTKSESLGFNSSSKVKGVEALPKASSRSFSVTALISKLVMKAARWNTKKMGKGYSEPLQGATMCSAVVMKSSGGI